jgi:hypothetical protein
MAITLSGDNGITFPNSTIQASAGQVLQVVQAVNSTATTTSAGPVDTGLTATITPKFSTSKILVVYTHALSAYRSDDNNYAYVYLYRGATLLNTQSGMLYTPINLIQASVGFSYLDTPATTSATTYKTQFASRTSSGSAYVTVNKSNGSGETTSSSIILMEIAG